MDPRAHVSPGFRPDRWVARQERPRARARRWERITDVYVAVLAALTLGAFLTGIVGAATQLQRAAVQWGRLPGEAPVSGAALAAAAVVLALAGLLRLGATLGPVAVDRAQAQWWLRLPAPTAPWLWRALLLRVVAGAALGGGAGLATAHGLLYARTTAGGGAGISAGEAWSHALAAGLLAGAATALVLAGCALVQASGRRRDLLALLRWSPAAALLPVLPALAGADVAAGLARGAGGAGAGTLLGAAAVAGLGAAALLAATRSRLHRIPHRDLRSAGDAAAHLGAAMFLLSVRQAGAALALEEGPGRRRRGVSPLLRVGRASPAGAWARADLAVLARTPGVGRRLASAWALPALLVLSEPGRLPLVLALGVAVAAVLATRAVGAGAEEVGRSPELERLLPIGRDAAWSVHTVAPALVLMPWGAGLGLVLALGTHGVGPSLGPVVLCGALAGVGLAGAVVRTATPDPVDWGAVMQAAQTTRAAGPLVRDAVRGADAAVLAVAPLALTPLLSAVPLGFAGVAGVVALIAWGIGRHVRPAG